MDRLFDRSFNPGWVGLFLLFWFTGKSFSQNDAPRIDSIQIQKCQSYIDLGNNHSDSDSAIYYYKRGVDYGLKHLEPDHPLVGDLYNKLGIEYKYKREFELALLFYEKALHLRKNRFGEKHPKVSAVYNNLGLLNKTIDRLPEAEQYLLKSLVIDRQALGPEHPFVAQTLNNLSLVYRSNGSFEKAISALNQAIEIKRKALGINHNSTGSSYNNLGLTYSQQGQYQKAFDYFNAALKIWLANQNYSGLATGYENLGNSSFLMGEVDISLGYYQKALSVLVPSFDSSSAAYTPPAENIPPGNVTLFVLGGKVRSLLSKYQQTREFEYLTYSLSTYHILFEVIDEMKKAFFYPSSKQEFIKEVFHQYENAIYNAYLAYGATSELKYLDQAFQWAEDSKSFILLESLRDEKAKFVAAIPEEIKAEEEGLLEDISRLKSQIYQLELRKDQDQNQLKGLKDQQLELSLAYEDFLKRTAVDYPNYYQLKYQDASISVSDVQENLLSQHNAVVEYFKGADHLFTFYIDQQQVSLHHQSIDDHFNSQINRFIDAIKTHNSVPQTFAKTSSELYDILVAPLQIGNNITHLNIVPDGVLNYVPFEILSSASDLDNYQQANYLFKDYSISYQYSTTIGLESLKNQE
ncbi:MAG: tetratricopeptide repeat protein, partial [Cyclobacteriaceae bacterium]